MVNEDFKGLVKGKGSLLNGKGRLIREGRDWLVEGVNRAHTGIPGLL